MTRLLPFLAAFAAAFPAIAGQASPVTTPPFTEAVLPIESDLYAVAIGPGGPGKEFGSDATNGGLYRIEPGSTPVAIELSDGQGLRNPTGLVEVDGHIVLVDGNQIISVTTDGVVNWRKTLTDDNVFLYDVEVLDEATLIVSDFGRGSFVSVSARSGETQPYLGDVQIDGLARFEITEAGILAVSWGADDAWDSALYLVSHSDETATAEMLSDGFGNLESVESVDGNVVVGGYRGHREFPSVKLMHITPDGTVRPLAAGSATQGVSDIYFDGSSIWLTNFYDAAYEMLPTQKLWDSQ